VDHETLLNKLELLDIRTSSKVWFMVYLPNHTQTLVYQGVQSTHWPVAIGIPQGGILRQLLFIIFINDLPDHLKHTYTHLYAKDTAIYHSASTSAELKDKISADLLNIEIWCVANKLTLNLVLVVESATTGSKSLSKQCATSLNSA